MVTAVLLGALSLHGGAGRVSGVLLGVVMIGVLNDGTSLLGVDGHCQVVANGALPLAAVAPGQRQRGVAEDG